MNQVTLKKLMHLLKHEKKSFIQTFVHHKVIFNKKIHKILVHFINIIKHLNIMIITKTFKQRVEHKWVIMHQKNNYGIQHMH